MNVEVSDLRFYVSNLRFFDAGGEQLTVELDENEFQYVDASGNAVLVDLTGTDAGACSGDGITFPEGTARTNAVVTGRVRGRRHRAGQLRRRPPADADEGGDRHPHRGGRAVAAGRDALVVGIRLPLPGHELRRRPCRRTPARATCTSAAPTAAATAPGR